MTTAMMIVRMRTPIPTPAPTTTGETAAGAAAAAAAPSCRGRLATFTIGNAPPSADWKDAPGAILLRESRKVAVEVTLWSQSKEDLPECWFCRFPQSVVNTVLDSSFSSRPSPDF